MAWPTNKPNSNQFNSDSDSIKQSRPELKTMSDAVNDIVDFIDTTNIQNNYILKYNSTSGALEFVAESAGGGLQNPLTEDIDLNGQRFENSSTAANDSFGAEGLVLGTTIDTIQFINTGTNQIYAPNQLNVYSGSGTVRINAESSGGSVLLGNQGSTSINGNLVLTADGSPPLGIEAQGSGSSNADFTIGNEDYRANITIENVRNPSAAGRSVSGSSEPSSEAITINPWGADTGTFRYPNYLNLHASNIRLGDPAYYTTDSAGRKAVIVETSDDQIQMQLGSQNGGRIFLDPSDSAGGGDISLYPGASGIIRLKYTNWPTADGSSGQVLQTNGAGTLSWVTPSGGGGGGTIDINAGSGISVTSNDSAGGYVIANTGMINLSDDAAPELGGNLNLMNFKIISTSAQDIKIEPDAAGDIYLESDTVYAGELNQQAHLTSQGTGDLLLSTNNQTSSGTIKINQGASANIEIQPDGGGKIRFHNAYNMPSSDGSAGQVMTTDGFGTLSFTTISGGGGGGDGVRDINAGTGISIQQDDSAGGYTISSTVVGGDTVSAGDNIEITAPDSTGAKGINFRNPFNTQIDAGDQIIKRPILQDYAETVNTIGSGGATVTPDQVDGNVQKLTLTTTPVTMNLPVNMPTGGSMTLILRQDAGGSKVVNFNASYKFAGGSKTLSTAPNAIDIVSVFYDGTDYLASLSTNFS